MTATLLKRRNGGGVAAKRAVGKARRHFRVRKNTAAPPSVPAWSSPGRAHISAQIIDDLKGHTLVSASRSTPPCGRRG